MALSADHGVRLSQTSPAFLHANSTSHTWIFSAIAELVDNAYDPDVNAANMWIDKRTVNGNTCLVLTDDGRGCAPDKLHKMLSFGYCEKIDIKGHKSIGQYGNGFKSGSMRLGKDAMVLTKYGKTMSVGFLSQTYLECIGAETVLVPVVTWHKREFQMVEAADAQGSLNAILKYSLFRSPDEILQEFQGIRSGSGTRIFIYNLAAGSDGKFELDFDSDSLDIINSEHQELDFAGGLMSRPVRDHQPEYRRSLREYLSILFLKPRMKISLRGCRVKTKLIRKSLSETRKTTYTPSWMNKVKEEYDPTMATGKKGVEIIFGFGPSKHDYGVMMYHRNRLIKAYEHVGVQKQANEMGVGVVGVVEVDFLEAIHNKQDFSKTDRYNACISALGIKLNQYWNAITGNADSANEFLGRPDWTWVQCEQCLKWRRLPDEAGNDQPIPEKWYCYMNPDMSHNRCDIQEEPEHEDEVFKLVVQKNTNTKKTKRNYPDLPEMINNPFVNSSSPVVVEPSGQYVGRGRQLQPKTEQVTPPRGLGVGRGNRMVPSGPSQRIKTERNRDDDSDDEDGSRKRRKKPKFTETTEEGGNTVLLLPSSDEEEDEDEMANVKLENSSVSVSESADGRTMVSFKEADTSSASGPTVKTEREKELSKRLENTLDKLGATNRKLGSLRRNIRTLLKILVPNFQLDNPEMVDRVVVEMINVNAANSNEADKESSTTEVVDADNMPSSSVDDADSETQENNNSLNKRVKIKTENDVLARWNSIPSSEVIALDDSDDEDNEESKAGETEAPASNNTEETPMTIEESSDSS